MKALKPLRFAFLLLIAICLFDSRAIAQKKSLPGLSRNSTVPEILEYLNESLFPYARIVIKSGVFEEQVLDPGVGYYTPSRWLLFSEGFKLTSAADDCHITLRNDDAVVYDAESTLSLISLASMTTTPPPHAVEFSTWLETASYDKGQASFYHNKNPEKNRLLGPWRTEFQSRGFFARSIFGVRIPALNRKHANKYWTSDKAIFVFDDKRRSERFDDAFRRLIKLCQPHSTKPRWNR